MFGKSTASRFNVQKNLVTPGPGEYDVKELKSTKRGGISTTERKFEYMKGSEFNHLGPGTYREKDANDGKNVPTLGVPQDIALDAEKALKKLAASWHKAYGTDTTKGQIKSRDDVVAFLTRTVADSAGASSESLSFKEEFDSVRSRLAEEVAISLKPGRQNLSSSSSAGGMSAWKKIEPLHKAADQASTDMQRKMSKLSSILGRLTDDLPAMVSVLAEPERERELKELAEAALVEAEEARKAADKAEEGHKELQMLLDSEKEKSSKALGRCAILERVVEEGSRRIKDLEERMASSSEEQGKVIDSLMELVSREVVAGGEDTSEELADLAEQLAEARRGESEALEELGALRGAYFSEAAESASAAIEMDEEAHRALEEAHLAAKNAVEEVHGYMELLRVAREEGRTARKGLAAERAVCRTLRRTLAHADGKLRDAMLRDEEGEVGGTWEGADELLACGWREGGEGEGEGGVVESLMEEVSGLAVRWCLLAGPLRCSTMSPATQLQAPCTSASWCPCHSS